MSDNQSTTALKHLDIFNMSKAQIQDFSNQIMNDSTANALEVIIRLKVMEEVRKNLEEIFKEKAMVDLRNRLQMEEGKSIQIGRMQLTLASRTNYSYSDTPMWNMLDGQIKSLKEKQKKIEEVAKVTQSPLNHLEFGMVYPAHPESDTEYITIKIPAV